MTRRARGLGAPSRIAVALLLAALAFAAAMMGGYGDNPVYAQTTVDYDDDDDGLIDVRSLAQLDAIRRDLDGNGDVAAGADTTAYSAAFPNRDTAAASRMGCPSGTCAGYELRAHLDFDTDGDGSTYTGTGANAASDNGDAYHNGGSGWAPIGTTFNATFKGNGYLISNMFIKRTSDDYVGLFARLSGSARVESLGVPNAFVDGDDFVGILVGYNRGTVTTSWTSGVARGDTYIGGLAGVNRNDSSSDAGEIIACYSRAAVDGRGAFSSNVRVGGLIGIQSNRANAKVIASYSTGPISSARGLTVGTGAGSLIGSNESGTVTNSYYDSTTSGAAIGPGAGHSTTDLQAPTGYAGIYSAWNVNVDGASGNDDPWHFGTASEYPVLKFGGMDPDLQRGDYDRDDDGLIEISTLAQLDAVRHDLDGNGDATAAAYAKAFLNRDATSGARMGCPSGNCAGYELIADLDFDTDGDGSTYSGSGASAASDSGDAYHNGGNGFEPIGDDSGNRFNTTFKGNGYIISNLFIKRASTGDVGLFGALNGPARVESVGLKNAYVSGARFVGALVGTNRGTVAASWSDGAVRGTRYVGGLVGYTYASSASEVGAITASYSHASTHASHATDPRVGGLTGIANSFGGHTARVIASYATGAVTAAGSQNVAGLTNDVNGSSSIVNSYWDTTASGVSAGGAGAGHDTATLQAPTGYAGIYENWNVNVDGTAGVDDPWDFGGASAYPRLKYGGMDPADQRHGDYDLDGDGLIEITTLAQLNAVRHDLDGDGDVAAGAPTTAYNAAFPDRITASATRMGCPSGTCAGYELEADLDFDTNGNGATYTGTGASATGDTGDAYNNGGNGFEPIGVDTPATARFQTTFKGNGHTISNLFIKRTSTQDVGLFGVARGTARIESLGLKNAFVHGGQYTGALVGSNYGTVAASWSSGAVRGSRGVGGLVGYQLNAAVIEQGLTIASYSHASVNSEASTGSNAYVGGLIGAIRGNGGRTARIIASYSTGAVTAIVSGNVGGFTTASGGYQVVNSYWDSNTSSIADDSGTAAPEGVNTAGLQTVLDYTGVYADWNVNLDGVAGGDDPWDFGQAGEYPALKYGGMDPAKQREGIVDYDRDGDGLIEIATLAQLDAVRHDLNGDGAVSAGAPTTAYNAAFTDRSAALEGTMGCAFGACSGYELAADLDFDTDGDGATFTGSGTSATSDGGDAYHNTGSGWLPIGADTSLATRFNTTFKGNGHVISNLFIKRATTDAVGLFGAVNSGARIESVGVKNAHVHGQNLAGVLVGRLYGPVTTSWVSGEVYANRWSGGFAGQLATPGAASVTASYSRANVTSAGSPGTELGGFTGEAAASTSITAVYATGTVTTAGGNRGGLVGAVNATATIAASYWDTATSAIADDADNNMPEGKTTSELQTPTGYTDDFADWNVNVDGTAGIDDPWDFGQAGAYPTLKFGGMDPADQRHGDYDLDGDGLIEISNLAQLNAVRHDLNGNGDATHADYVAAFPDRITASGARMGCPSGSCAGYELIADLDFDTDGDGSTYSGTGASATGDPDDAYYNGGMGWAQIGADSGASRFSATFKGNGFIISNLFIRRTNTNDVGLFGALSGPARVESVGLKNAYVYARSYVGSLVGTNRGTVAASWSDGAVRGSRYVGGLVGYTFASSGSEAGAITASYSHASAHASNSVNAQVGGLTGVAHSTGGNARVIASYSTGAVTAAVSQAVAGLTNVQGGSSIVNSYWNTTTSGVSAGGGAGHDTATLQAPTGYTGIYENWNVNLDGAAGGDDPWDFGGASAYPRLKYGGMDPDDQRFGDYDLDGDGLIEIRDLAQLDAVRHDLDGDGNVAAGAPLTAYDAAFSERITAPAALMGCPSGTCAGYELAADLDFDTDGDGDVDAKDAYPNWTPIGDSTNGYAADFDGNSNDIANLTIARTANDEDVGLFGRVASTSVISGVGLPDASVTSSGSGGSLYIGALVGYLGGTVRSSYATGTVSQTGTGNFAFIGGLTGYMPAGSTVAASWSGARVSSSGVSTGAGGITGRLNGGTIKAAHSAGAVSATGNSAYAGGAAGVLHMGSVDVFYASAPATSTGTGGTAHPIGSGIAGSNATISLTYWDSTTTGVADDADTAAPEGVATAGLQTVLDYTGVYENWNVDVDGATGADDPWHFGRAGEYPALKFDGMDTERQRFGDYDRDADGLIEISTLAQLDAVRHDLNGDGDVAAGAATTAYDAAFPGRNPASTGRMGCTAGACAGYELIAHLDFDTDGDGSTYTGTGNAAVGDPDDAFYNGGSGWAPIGDDSGNRFDAAFKGNGHVISNLFIKRATTDDVGLFGSIDGGARVESLGLNDAFVHGRYYVGVIVGTNYGTVAASWSSGAVRGGIQVGGLVGLTNKTSANQEGQIIAGYSRASAHASHATLTNAYAGGLAGASSSTTAAALIIASYSTGAVTAAQSGLAAGLTTLLNSATVTNSYWDSTATANTGGGGSSQTTSALQTPASYTGIFANWDVNVDGVTGNDDPWHFGFSSSYPTLKYGGMDPYTQYGGDYDTDNDGLIEIWNLDRLNAVRWDLDGDAVQDTTSDADWKRHAAAFPGAIASLGCPDTMADADSDPGPCEGYELARDLDFNDANADGEVDRVRAYPNWTPIGSAASPFSGDFDGNNHKIANLKIAAPGASASIGLFGSASGTVKKTGLPNAQISVTGGDADTHIGALLGETSGDALGNWSTGTVTQTGGTGGDVGGLIGYSSAGRTGASWSSATVTTDASRARAGGLGGRIGGEAIVAVYSTGAVTASGTGAYAGGLMGEMEPLTDGFTSAYVTGPVTKTGDCGGANPLYAIASGLPANAVAGLYWNAETTGFPTRPGIQQRGHASGELQAPTAYAATIYANWAVDVDGDGAVDTPLWDFGTTTAYPKLTWDGMDAAAQTIAPTTRSASTAPPCAW